MERRDVWSGGGGAWSDSSRYIRYIADLDFLLLMRLHSNVHRSLEFPNWKKAQSKSIRDRRNTQASFHPPICHLTLLAAVGRTSGIRYQT